MMDRADPYLLHFTHVRNLAGIAAGGLVADNNGACPEVDCAEQGIKDQRRNRQVPISPRGVVADYAPFYYAARSPMLFRIGKGGVRGYEDGQRPLIYLVSRLSRVVAHNLTWVATDRNAALSTARFTNLAQDLPAHIDWAVIEGQDWRNTAEDGSRKQRRAAEFLVHQRVPWTAISHIAAIDSSQLASVQARIPGTDHAPGLIVRPNWYF